MITYGVPREFSAEEAFEAVHARPKGWVIGCLYFFAAFLPVLAGVTFSRGEEVTLFLFGIFFAGPAFALLALIRRGLDRRAKAAAGLVPLMRGDDRVSRAPGTARLSSRVSVRRDVVAVVLAVCLSPVMLFLALFVHDGFIAPVFLPNAPADTAEELPAIEGSTLLTERTVSDILFCIGVDCPSYSAYYEVPTNFELDDLTAYAESAGLTDISSGTPEPVYEGATPSPPYVTGFVDDTFVRFELTGTTVYDLETDATNVRIEGVDSAVYVHITESGPRGVPR